MHFENNVPCRSKRTGRSCRRARSIIEARQGGAGSHAGEPAFWPTCLFPSNPTRQGGASSTHSAQSLTEATTIPLAGSPGPVTRLGAIHQSKDGRNQAEAVVRLGDAQAAWDAGTLSDQKENRTPTRTC